MKTSDSDLKVNRNIYPDAVTCDRLHLIGPKCDHLGPITIAYLKSPNEKTSSFCLHKHVPTSIRKKSYAAREQPPRICKNNKPKIQA